MLRIIEIDGAQAQVVGYYNDKEHLLLQFLKVLPPADRRISKNSPFAVYRTDEVKL
jgi:hypothetical protein